MGKVMLVLIMVLGFAASASAWVDWTAPQDGVARDFGDGANWAGGLVPAYQNAGTSPGPFDTDVDGDEAAISHSNMYAQIYAGEDYTFRVLTLGRNSGSPANPGQLDIFGIVRISDWTVNLGWEGGGYGVLNVSGSILAETDNVVVSIGLNRDALTWTEQKGGGQINILDGGYIEVGANQGGVWIGSDGDDLMTITGNGKLVVKNADLTVKLNDYVTAGLIVGDDGTTPVAYWDGTDTILEILRLSKASNFDPKNDEENVALDAVLTWDPPDPNALLDSTNPVIYNVYFGVEPNEFSPYFDFPMTSQEETFYDPFDAGLMDVLTEYYWRVDAVDPNFGGPIIHEPGDVLHFVTRAASATLPFPLDEATDVAQNVILQWAGGTGALSHDVYISTVLSEVEDGTAPMVNVSVEEYDPPDLIWGETYYWAVDEHYTDPPVVEGTVWSFTVTTTRQCAPEMPADADNNCIVDLRDLAIMAGDWQVCTLANGDCP